MEKLRNDVIKQIRGLVIATKGRVSLRQLSRDYSAIIGERIPYQKFGCQRLEDFIQSEPTLILSKDNTGECYVAARSSEKSAHISEMVSRQKPSKRKPPPRVRFHMPAANTSRWRPRDVNPRWQRPRNQIPPRLAGVNQIIKHISSNPVPSKVVVPPHSTLNQPSTLRHMTVTTDAGLSQRHVTLNEHYSTTSNGGTSSASGRNIKSSSTSRNISQHSEGTGASNSELLTKKRITQKVNNIIRQDSTNGGHSSTVGGNQLLTKKRITQKMEQLSLGKENYNSINALPPLKSPVLPLQSPVLPLQSPTVPSRTPSAVLSRTSSTGSMFSLDSNHSAASTDYTTAGTPAVLRMNSTGSVISVDSSNDSAAGTGHSTTGTAVLRSNFSRTPSPEFVRTADAMEDLEKFAQLHKLGEVKVSNKIVKTKANRFFTCKITVTEDHNYTTYPMEFDNELSAQNHCAEEALTELIKKYSRRKSLLLSSDLDILERIPPMLEQHSHGIWASQLKLDYSDKYNEQLPDDWLKVVDTVPTVQIEKCSNDYILRHCKPGDVLQKAQRRTGFDIPDVSVPSNTVHFDADTNKISAQVTNIMAANEIWCRQFMTDESEQYNDMMSRLEIYYGGREATLKPETIKEAGYYVAKYDGSYYRIRALGINEIEVNCFFIDFGFESMIPKEDIFQLRREFASAQAQAFVCRLVGLEELYEVSADSQSLDEYIYREVTLELATEAQSLDSSDIIPVYMYDYKIGNSINEELIPILAMESACPVLQPLPLIKDTITQVNITNIESNGDVYVQIQSPGYEVLQSLLAEIESQINGNKLQPPAKPVTKSESQDKIYLAQDKIAKDGHWRRAKLIDWSPNGDLAQIYYIDYGNADVIHVAKEPLYPLEGLSEVLSQYPAQAVKTRMALDSVPGDFKSIAEKAMPVGQSVLLKLVGQNGDDAPWAEFFTRNSDGGLFCINKSISVEMELKNSGDGNNNLKTGKRTLGQLDGNKNVPSAGTLKEPPLPNKEEFFEVRVSFAVNPYNFFVQPLESNNELNELMERLQERYKDVLYSPLHLDQIEPGNIYASKHEDGFWYRTSVIKVIHSGSISVFYCDFGYYANLTVQQLIPLDIEFIALPYQALKAKLSGIKPKQSKWSMDDCENFKQLVEKRSFYSMLLDTERDVLYESDFVLKLLLIDTSGDEDVYIDKLLISEGVAVKE